MTIRRAWLYSSAALVVTGALVALLAAAGQSSGAVPDRGRTLSLTVPTTSAAPVEYRVPDAEILDDGSMVLPSDAYDDFTVPAYRVLIADAMTGAERKCMESRNLPMPSDLVETLVPQEPPASVYYGVATMQLAKDYGYRTPPSYLPSASTGGGASIPQAVLSAFYGGALGQGGCLIGAQSMTDENLLGEAFGRLQDLRQESAALAGPRIRASYERTSTGAHACRPLGTAIPTRWLRAATRPFSDGDCRRPPGRRFHQPRQRRRRPPKQMSRARNTSGIYRHMPQ